MSTIAVIGATGYAGGHIVTEALSRHHEVIAVNRTGSFQGDPAVTVKAGTIHDSALVDELAAAADVIIVTIHPEDADGTKLIDALPGLLAAAVETNTRIGVVGGAGSLKISQDGPTLVETPNFPEEFKSVALAHNDVLDALRASNTKADWFYLSPAATFGSWAPGTRTGKYRVSDDLLLTDASGNSKISGADYAIAIVDEIENPAHHQARFAVAN